MTLGAGSREPVSQPLGLRFPRDYLSCRRCGGSGSFWSGGALRRGPRALDDELSKSLILLFELLVLRAELCLLSSRGGGLGIAEWCRGGDYT